MNFNIFFCFSLLLFIYYNIQIIGSENQYGRNKHADIISDKLEEHQDRGDEEKQGETNREDMSIEPQYNGDKRKFILTKDDMSFTKMEPKIDAQPCADHQSVSIFILSTATTEGRHYLKREAQRKTWVSEAKENNISVYFVIGLSENQTTNQLLREESNQYKDMIQMQLIDHYYNQTIKTVSILRWAQNKCNKSKLIIKSDDDIIINIDMLLHNLNVFKSGITGHKYWKPSVIRNPNKKCWFPKQKYKPDHLSPFVCGSFYAVTTDVIPKLLETLETYSDPVLDIEDQFVTGLLAEKAGVPRFDLPQLILRHSCNLEHKCEISERIVITNCHSSEDLIQLYENWKKINASKQC